MGEDVGLRYRLRGDGTPQGRPRVYLCCHEDDFSACFERVVGEILEAQRNAVVWYRDPAGGAPSHDALLRDLSQMQLLVVPVTSRFLFEDCNARIVEFAYAIDSHIPVLPLMQEPGLEKDFNRVCGNIQFLDRRATAEDPTAIPYETRLEQFLKSVLASDELVESVRSAFDAYVFLSYRKRDRAEAQRVMRLIHGSDSCRDLAIWYDEFLVPGEDFNGAIVDAMRRSSLFALVVTPSLLEQPNYVMDTEYPAARAFGMPVLPIEAAPTDRDALASHYEGIEDVVLPDERQGLGGSVVPLLSGVSLRGDSSPRHDYLMGIAYLLGIDVEVDRERAVALIEESANRGLSEAYERLVSMYRNGEGVGRDWREAMVWQERYTRLLEERASSCNESDLEALYTQLVFLGDLWLEVDDGGASLEAYDKAAACIERAKPHWGPRWSRRKAVCYAGRSLACNSLGRFEDALHWADLSLQSSQALAKETNALVAWYDLAAGHGRMAAILDSLGREAEAGEQLRRSVEVSEAIARQSSRLQDRRGLSIRYANMGVWCQKQGKLREAEGWFHKDLDIAASIADETGSDEDREYLAISLTNMGSLYMDRGNRAEARSWYEKCLRLTRGLSEETRSVSARRSLSICCERLGRLLIEEGSYDSAEVVLRESLVIRRELVAEAGSLRASVDLANALVNMGGLNGARGDLDGARLWYERSLEVWEHLIDGTAVTPETLRGLSVAYSRLGNVRESMGDYDEALVLYLRDLDVAEQLAEGADSVESLQDLSTSLVRVGDVLGKLGLPEEAEPYYRRALRVDEKLAATTELADHLECMSDDCVRLGLLCLGQRNIEEAAELLRRGFGIEEGLCASDPKRSWKLAMNYRGVGDKVREHDSQEALRWYDKARVLQERITGDTHTSQRVGVPNARLILCETYCRMGEASMEAGDQEGAREWMFHSVSYAHSVAQSDKSLKSLDELAVTCYKTLTLVPLTRDEWELYLGIFESVSSVLLKSTDDDRYRGFLETATELRDMMSQ